MTEQAAATNEAPQTTDAPATGDSAPAADANDTAQTDEATSDSDTASPAATNDNDWFMRDKFATEVDQAKAYPELLKRMGENWGAPKENYTLDSIEGIVKDDPLLEHLAPALKELGLSQKGFANLIKSYQDANVKLGEKIAEAVKTELTQKDALTVTAVDKWITNSFDEKQQSTIRSWIVSVEDFQLLNQLRVMLPQSTSVPSSLSGTAKAESVQEVENEKIKYRKEVTQGLRVEDKNYSNELQQRFKDAYTREQYGKKKQLAILMQLPIMDLDIHRPGQIGYLW